MKKKSLIPFWFIFYIPFLVGQKNSFSFVYTPAITKLRMNDVKEFGDNIFIGEYKAWYDTKKPVQSMYGYNLGFVYERYIKKKISLALGIFHTVLTASSGNFYQVKGLKDYHSDYGGVAYTLIYEGLEIPLNLHYQIYLKNKLAVELNVGSSFNVMGQFSVEDYLIEKISGEKFNTGSYLRISDPKIKYYLDKLEDKYFQRIGFCLGLKLDYKLHKHISISTMPIIKYYSNALEKSYVVEALRADAFLFGIQSQIDFNF